MEMHGLDLGLDKTDPVSAAPSFLSGSVGHGGCSMVMGGAHLPMLLQLANEFMLTRERKMKLRLNEGRKPAFSEGTAHVSRTPAPDVASENVSTRSVRQQKCSVPQLLFWNNVV